MQNFRKNEVNIMCKRVYLKAKDAEKEMQEARKADQEWQEDSKLQGKKMNFQKRFMNLILDGWMKNLQ